MTAAAVHRELDGVVYEMPTVDVEAVLHALGQATFWFSMAETPEQEEVSLRLLTAAEAELDKRDIPQEIRDTVKGQALQGRFVSDMKGGS